MKKSEDQRYLDALDFIKNLTTFGINLGLDRIIELMRRLDNPERKVKVIHVGGTNGKGSTSAILQAVLVEAGYRVGMFISPHLHDYRERIQINDEMISCDEVTACMEVIRPVLEEMLQDGLEHPTEFEVSTALALFYFARKQPDFVIMEVGLGGEIDSTNVVQPLVSVLTSIGMDHMDYLGNSLAEITKVKAGIIKQGIPLVTSAEKQESLQIIEQKAEAMGSRLVRVRRQGTEDRRQKSEVRIQESESADSVGFFHYDGLKWKFQDLELGLLGRHQFLNSAAALAVCEVMEDIGEAQVSEDALRRGLKKVKWPARLELVSSKPKVLIDGAHNADGMMTLARALKDYESGVLNRRRLVLCMGVLGDKEVGKIVDIIVPRADELYVSKPDSPRAGNWKQVACLAEKYLVRENIHIFEDPICAVREAMKKISPDDMLVVTGSLYMIAHVRMYLLG